MTHLIATPSDRQFRKYLRMRGHPMAKEPKQHFIHVNEETGAEEVFATAPTDRKTLTIWTKGRFEETRTYNIVPVTNNEKMPKRKWYGRRDWDGNYTTPRNHSPRCGEGGGRGDGRPCAFDLGRWRCGFSSCCRCLGVGGFGRWEDEKMRMTKKQKQQHLRLTYLVLRDWNNNPHKYSQETIQFALDDFGRLVMPKERKKPRLRIVK
jgi:hypothetical protein